MLQLIATNYFDITNNCSLTRLMHVLFNDSENNLGDKAATFHYINKTLETTFYLTITRPSTYQFKELMNIKTMCTKN